MTVQEWLGTENQLGQDIWERKYRYENETLMSGLIVYLVEIQKLLI